MPTGLMMFAMAQALWDRSRTYGAVEEDYFRSAFGPDWPKARGYLSELSEAFDPERIRGDRTRPLSAGQNVHCDTPSGFERVAELIESFAPVIAQNEALSTPAWAASWRYLRHHADLCGPLAQAYAAREQGDTDEARRHWQTVEQLAWEREPDVHSVLDVYLFANTLAPRFAS